MGMLLCLEKTAIDDQIFIFYCAGAASQRSLEYSDPCDIDLANEGEHLLSESGLVPEICHQQGELSAFVVYGNCRA